MDGEALIETEGETEGLAVPVEGEALALTLALTEGEALGEGEADGLLLSLTEGLTLGEADPMDSLNVSQ